LFLYSNELQHIKRNQVSLFSSNINYLTAFYLAALLRFMYAVRPRHASNSPVYFSTFQSDVTSG